MKLHPVSHGPRSNRYCGPAALSALTGRTSDEMAALLRRVTGRRSITGTRSDEIRDALDVLGYRMAGVADYRYKGSIKAPTLSAWLRSYTRALGAVYLICAGKHWQLVSGRRFVCGVTKEVVSIRDPRVKRRARLKYAWRIEPK